MANYKGLKDKIYICGYCEKNIEFRGYSHDHKFCNTQCASAFRSKQSLIENMRLFEQGLLTLRKAIYKILVLRDGNKCSVCGITNWNGTAIRLWVDHIDGDATNNMPFNFRLICPNCDSQSATFGARNNGRGRKSRGLSMYG